MNPLPLGSHYHERGLEQIAQQNALDDLMRRQRRQIRTAVWFPIWCALFCAWALALLWYVLDYAGVR